MIKLIATDMDGTLLNASREIDAEFYDLLDRLDERNIIMAFASGRNLQSLTGLIPEEIHNRIMFISNNGNGIVYKGKQIHLSTISMEDVRLAKKAIAKFDGVRSIVCIDNVIYTDSLENWCIGKIKGYKQVLKKDITKLSGNPEKYTIFTEESNQLDVLEALAPLRDRLNIVPSGKVTIDISAKGVNKGTAIKMVQEIYSISKEETMVFGDYLNDLEMMDSAYYSYAMENAHPKLKEKANYIAGHHADKGVIRAIIKQLELDEF